MASRAFCAVIFSSVLSSSVYWSDAVVVVVAVPEEEWVTTADDAAVGIVEEVGKESEIGEILGDFV